MNFRRSGTDLGDLNRKSVSSGQRTRRTTVVDERPDEVLPSGSEQAHASLTLGDLPTRRRRTTYDVKLSDLSPESQEARRKEQRRMGSEIRRLRIQAAKLEKVGQVNDSPAPAENSIVEKRKVYRVADLTEEEKQERLERKRQQRRESDRRCREKKRAELLRIRQLEAANSSLNGSDVGNSMIALNQKNQTTSGNVTLSDNFSPASVGRKNRSANSSLSGKGRRNSLAGLSEAEKEDRRKMQRREARRRYEERIKAGKLREENEKTPINDPTPRPVGPRRAAPMSLQEKKKQHRNEKAQLSRQEAKKNRDRELAKKRDYMRNYRESKKAEKETEKNDEPEKSLDDSESRTCTDDSDFDDDSFSESEEIFAQVQGRPQNLKSLSLVELRHSRAVGNEVDVMTDLKLWIMDLPPELDQFWNPLFTLCNEMNRGNCWELRKKFLQLHWGTDAKVHNTSLKPRWKSYFYHMWDTILREDYRTPPTCMICQRYECLKVGQLLWCPQYPQFFAVHEFCLQSIPELHEDRVSTGLASFSFESYSIVNLAKAVRRRGFINKCAKADCFKPNAMIGCAEKKCVRSYHLPCLFESQGFYDFLHLTAYCKREKLSEVASELQELVDEIEVARKENKRKESAESEMTEEEEEATEEYTEKICGECEDPLDQTRVIFNEVVVGACCGTAYYHYDCILKRATRQGLNFRCPICGSDEEDTFLRLMALQGIHPPNHSAPGSREEKPRCYFARTMRNDGRGCLCPLGATHFSGIPGEDPNFDGKWRSMPRCDICGVFAHLGCAGLPFSRSPFTCDDFDMKNLKRSPWYCDDCCHTYQVVSQKPTRKQIYDLEMGRRTGSLAKKALKGPKIVHEAIGDGERIVGSNVSTIPSQDSGVFGREDEASERVVSSDSAVPEVQAATEPPSSENQFEVNMAIDDVKTFPMLFSLDEDQLLEETPARDPLEGLEEEIDDFDSIAPENDLTTSIDEETEGTERRPEDFHDLAAALKHLETRRDPEIVWSEAPPQVQPAFIANEIEKAPNTDQQQEQLNTVKTENLDDMPLEILEPVRRRTCDIDIIQLDDSDEDDAPVEVTWKLATPQTIRMQEPQTPTTNFRASAEPNSVDSGKGRRTTPKGSKTLIEKDEKPDVPLNTVLDKWLSRARTPGKSSTPQTPSNGNEKAPDVTTVLSSKRMNNQEGSTPKRMKQELPVGTVAKSEERQPSVVQLENDCYISYSSDDDEIVVLSTFNTQKNVWQRGN